MSIIASTPKSTAAPSIGRPKLASVPARKPAPCSNRYLGDQTCIKQWESWWDNNGSPGKPIARKLERDQYIARGKGMAFKIHQYFPKEWKSEAKSYWTW